MCHLKQKHWSGYAVTPIIFSAGTDKFACSWLRSITGNASWKLAHWQLTSPKSPCARSNARIGTFPAPWFSTSCLLFMAGVTEGCYKGMVHKLLRQTPRKLWIPSNNRYQAASNTQLLQGSESHAGEALGSHYVHEVWGILLTWRHPLILFLSLHLTRLS